MEAYAFNGRVPGPEFRVTEGDTVKVTVRNELAEPTTVHWHGVELPVEMDGVPELSQKPIPPGGTFTYEFVATPAGTRWYHSHVNELAQQGGGLVGALIIEPRQLASPKPDREYVVMTGEFATQPAAASAPPIIGGMGGMMQQPAAPAFDTYTVNGKTYPATPPLVVRQGERVRLRLINAAATSTQVFALPGHTLTVTHADGNPLPHPVQAEAVPLG